METFAKRFKRALEIKGKTQSQISTYAEVDQAAVSNYVAGRYSPRPETAKRIAEYLGVSEAWLMGYDVPARYISQLMGHSSEDMINKVYMHVFAEKQQEYASRLFAQTEDLLKK